MFNKLLELLLAQPFFMINVKGLGIMVEDYDGVKQEATQIGFKDGEKDSTISCVGLSQVRIILGQNPFIFQKVSVYLQRKMLL